MIKTIEKYYNVLNHEQLGKLIYYSMKVREGEEVDLTNEDRITKALFKTYFKPAAIKDVETRKKRSAAARKGGGRPKKQKEEQ